MISVSKGLILFLSQSRSILWSQRGRCTLD